MNKVDLLIDADPLVYACGYVAEERRHLLHWVDVIEGRADQPHTAEFEYAWRRDAFVELMNLHPDEYVTETRSVPYPLGFAVQAMRTAIRGIEDQVQAYLELNDLERGRTRLYLTHGASNFRLGLGLILPYKGTRSGKPFWYKELRRWLIHERGAKLCRGHEADDEIAIVQWGTAYRTQPSTIICTIDKDLKQVPGLHYNTRTKEAFYVTPEQADRHFYWQLLQGDTVDNIPGCKRIGPAKADTLLASLGTSTTPAAMYALALETYRANMEKYPEHHAPHTTPEASLLENARLLYMLRKKGDVWRPPT